MPLYRQHAALLRGEVDVAHGTLASWCIKAGMLLKPLYEAMRPILMAEPLIHGDEATVQVLKEDGRKAQSKSYMWVYRSGKRSEVSFQAPDRYLTVLPVDCIELFAFTNVSDGTVDFRERIGGRAGHCTGSQVASYYQRILDLKSEPLPTLLVAQKYFSGQRMI